MHKQLIYFCGGKHNEDQQNYSENRGGTTALSLWKDESGQGVVEYVVILAVLSLVTTLGLTSLGNKTNSTIAEANEGFGHEVVFEAEDGVVQRGFINAYQPIVTPKAPEKDGQTFLGWTLDGENTATEEQIRAAMTNGGPVSLTPIYVYDYTYTIKNNQVTITGLSETGLAKPFVTTMPETIEGDPVTAISSNAFRDCENIALSSLSSGILDIGENAFRGCVNLALTSLPSGITSIKWGTFLDCTNLTLTTLPNGVSEIEQSAFMNCSNLSLESLPDALTSIGPFAFQNCVAMALTELPDMLVAIGRNAFYNCASLALTQLPEGITIIEAQTFTNCTNLALISLPSGLTSIGNYAFDHCYNLLLTNVPNSLTEISINAFANCSNVNITTVPCPYVTNAFYGTKCENPTIAIL